jgi:hypothetical protein
MIDLDLFNQIVTEAKAIANDEALMRLQGTPKNHPEDFTAGVRRDRIRELRRLRRIATKGRSRREQRELDAFHKEMLNSRLPQAP